jgi:Tol biopolymer transport system component
VIVYVQSNRQNHDLGIKRANQVIIRENAAAPAWSPSGEQIAFFGEAPEYNTGIWVMTERGQNPTQLFPARQAPALDQNVKDHIKNIAWSPDGTKLAFEVDTPSDQPMVWVINAAVGTRISDPFPGRQPAWSPEGQGLAINTCFRNDCGLWRVDFLGGSQIRLTDNSSDSYPVWSPLGYLAFSRQSGNGGWELYQLRLPNSLNSLDEQWLDEHPPQQLTFLNSTSTTPVFNSSGQRIFFRTDARGGSDNWDILAIDLADDGAGPGDVQRIPIQEGIGPSDDAGLARPAVY